MFYLDMHMACCDLDMCMAAAYAPMDSERSQGRHS